MLNYEEITQKYLDKFGKYIGCPFNGFSSEEEKQKYYEVCLECINENREFNEGKDDSARFLANYQMNL